MEQRGLELLLLNAASATLLAAVVLLVSWRLRRPALLHTLWLLVLLKLVAPPVFGLALLPRAASPVAAQAAPAPATVVLPQVGPAALPAAVARMVPAFDPYRAVGGLWLAGTALLLGLALIRLRRFGRGLRRAVPVAARMQSEIDGLARRLGLSRAPRTLLVEGRLPPLLWSVPGYCRLLLPAGLATRLTAAQRETLLLHELAHYRRRDHWVRYLELLTGALFWWCPVVWWVHRRLRACEEQCCDALVLETLPGQARDYAEGLLRTLEFLSGRHSLTPALATGAGDLRFLRERLTMILCDDVPRKLNRRQRLALGATAAFVLLVGPAWLDRDHAGAAPPREEQAPAADREAALRDPEAALPKQEAALREQEAALRDPEAALRKQEAALREQEAALREQEAALRDPEAALREQEAALRAEEAALQRRLELVNQQLRSLRRPGATPGEAAALERLEAERRAVDAARLRDELETLQELRTHARHGAATIESEELHRRLETLRNLELREQPAALESEGPRIELEAELARTLNALDEARSVDDARLALLLERRAEQLASAAAGLAEPDARAAELELLQRSLADVERQREQLALEERARSRAGKRERVKDADRRRAEQERIEREPRQPEPR